MVTRKEEGWAYYMEGTMVANHLVLDIHVVVLTCGIRRTDQSKERKGRREAAELWERIPMLYFGATTSLDLITMVGSLNRMRAERGSQCR